MGKTFFSMNDAYPNSISNTLTISEQTIPTHDEDNYNIDSQVSTDNHGVTKTNDTSLVWGSLLLLVGLLVALHFMG